MKIISPLGIASDEMPTGNLVWVDSINGNDSLAIRGRLKSPFKTLTAAKNAAQFPDTIMVLPGEYSDCDLAKSGVNWHFIDGARVVGNQSGTSLFRVVSGGSFQVTGRGYFNSGMGDHVLEITNATAGLYFECRYLQGARSAVHMTAGDVRVYADEVVGDLAATVYVSGGTLFLKTRFLFGDASEAVVIAGGTVDLDVYRVYSGGSKAIRFTAGTGLVRAVEIVSYSTCAVEFNNSYSNPLMIRGARIISKLPNSVNGRAVYIASSSNAVRLANCVLIVDRTGPTIADCIGAASAQSVYMNGHCLGNSSITNVTMTPGSAWATDNNLR